MMTGLARRWRNMAEQRRLKTMDPRLRADIGLASDSGYTCPTDAQKMGRYAIFRIHTS